MEVSEGEKETTTVSDHILDIGVNLGHKRKALAAFSYLQVPFIDETAQIDKIRRCSFSEGHMLVSCCPMMKWPASSSRPVQEKSPELANLLIGTTQPTLTRARLKSHLQYSTLTCE